MAIQVRAFIPTDSEFITTILYVFSGNTHAQRVYDKHGFQQEIVNMLKLSNRIGKRKLHEYSYP